MNSSWVKSGVNVGSCYFPLISMTPLDPLVCGKMVENPLHFQRNFFPENDVLECAHYFNCMNQFTAMSQKVLFFGIRSFVKAKDWLN